jgi:transcription initiation factor IIE alpha subunit
MTKTKKSEAVEAITVLTKHQQVVDLLMRDGAATREELATLANWLPHSTRAYLTGLKKKGHLIDSNKVDGVRRYRITSSMAA